VEEFQDAAEFEEVRREPSPRNPAQKKSTIQVKLRQAGGETHVLWMKQRGWVSSHPPEDPTVA
jgi:hypothetical protein